jgi:hypothetical protein
VDGETQLLVVEKVEDLAPARGTGGGEGDDAAGLEAVRLGAADAGQGPGEIAGAALGVGNRLGSVEAGADLDLVLAKQSAEVVVEQPEVALDGETQSLRTRRSRSPVNNWRNRAGPAIRGSPPWRVTLTLVMPVSAAMRATNSTAASATASDMIGPWCGPKQ